LALSWVECQCERPTGRPGTRDDGPLSDRLLATRHHVRTSHAPQGRGGHQVANIKPLEDKIVVQASEAETTTASGIVIPDTAKEKPQEGKVLAVGPGRIDDNGNRVPLDVQVGDVVIYSKYGGTEVKYNGEEYLILSARDVLAVVN
jgi:chaperonin GroES